MLSGRMRRNYWKSHFRVSADPLNVKEPTPVSRPRNSESVFRAIADPKRRRILDLLGKRDCSVGELLETMRMQRADASYHLGVLMQAGLLRQRRRGRSLVCSCDLRPLTTPHAWLGLHLARSGRVVKDDGSAA